jgi:bifunctional non-homologous end joining protein LigD
MLATLVAEPFHRPGWVYEEKYDGYRILAYKEGARVTLFSRNGKDRTATFPEIARSVGALRPRTLVLDGEVVAFDEDLVSRFQLIQQGEAPRLFAVFDCLYADGKDLRRAGLDVRRAALERAVEGADRIFPSRRLRANGLAASRLAEAKGFEGLVAKDRAAPYVEGRTTRWLKVKVKQEGDFVIGGYTAPAGTRPHFGALLLGAYEGKALRYVGKVGTGFTLARLAELHRTFRPLVRPTAPFAEPPREKETTWLEPKLVAEVAFHEMTADRKLRQPVFVRLRDDKNPSECRLADV